MTSEQVQPLYRKKLKAGELPDFLEMIRSQGIGAQNLLFLCIGTDRSTGDALGPLVGTMLQEAGYPHVVGSLEFPFDASNMRERLQEIPPGLKIVAIDACLGQAVSLGWYQVSNRPIEPGKSVGKQLPLVGDYSIAAIVNVDQGQKYAILQSTSLYRIMTMAREIAKAIFTVFPLKAGSDREKEGGA
ncbi:MULTISPECIES: spore protease YyaC [unclassified Paenibacillus]|uniref:spore protease YyaC n=1 Tax=unclassified Paenibacillus TaxID=185978 RepID=UPI001AE8B435|nr:MULTISPECIES: spore protease YyaC [unclassified Paenibacillus]MBP1157210.1 putative sporulation protein YyaC [Paenibacillus sp. PvP091]MBP1172051.1 putative sporulation protein YyaC [Paenibacillus sp. PvR098]MBP2438432.1 putative sporulation protein YyaC [Paenibacillus sp. PvP052]